MRFNKKLQNIFGLGINDYKDNFEKIIIEIIPKNLYRYDFHKEEFIKFKESNNSFYHIFFDDEKDEFKSSDVDNYERIKKIKIIIDYNIKTFEELFKYNPLIEKINFIQFNRKDIINMSYMFCGCSSLKEIDLSNFKTDKVKDMSFMFYGCSSLKELNISKFKTDNVQFMSYMFNDCKFLIKLNLSNFITNMLKV